MTLGLSARWSYKILKSPSAKNNSKNTMGQYYPYKGQSYPDLPIPHCMNSESDEDLFWKTGPGRLKVKLILPLRMTRVLPPPHLLCSHLLMPPPSCWRPSRSLLHIHSPPLWVTRTLTQVKNAVYYVFKLFKIFTAYP